MADYLEARYKKSRSVARTSSTPGLSTLMTTSFLLSLSTASQRKCLASHGKTHFLSTVLGSLTLRAKSTGDLFFKRQATKENIPRGSCDGSTYLQASRMCSRGIPWHWAAAGILDSRSASPCSLAHTTKMPCAPFTHQRIKMVQTSTHVAHLGWACD